MRVFLISSLLLALAWVGHVIIWRVSLPKHHIRALLVVFAVVFACWLALAFVWEVSWLELARIALFYAVMALCYIITYSAIEGDSPTLSLIHALAKKGGEGLREAEMDNFVAERPFVTMRLAALVHSGLVRESDGGYVICGKPSLFFRLILGFRKLYGPISKGG